MWSGEGEIIVDRTVEGSQKTRMCRKARHYSRRRSSGKSDGGSQRNLKLCRAAAAFSEPVGVKKKPEVSPVFV